MKATIDFDDNLYRQIKIEAARRGTTVRDLLSAGARMVLAAPRVAADAPWECVKACAQLVAAAEALAGRSNVNAASDVLVAALLGEAAARGAAENVRINLPATGDDIYGDTMNQQLDSALHEIAAIAARTREIVLSGQAQEPEAE